MELTGAIQIKGHLTLTTLRPDGSVRDRREGDNVMCTAGYSAIAAALVWSGLQDQATNIGVTSPTFLTPLYGAVGSGSGTPAKSDTALFTELARQTVGAGAASPATPSIAGTAAWLFYFPPPAATWTVTEAGVFAGATSAPGSGALVDHWSLATPMTVPPSDTVILEVSLGVGP